MVNSMVVRATSSQLIGPDWAMNIEICDMLNHDPGQAKDVVKGIKKRMGSKNPKVQLLSLTLLETVVKNCGDVVHMHVAEREIPHEMVKIARKKPDFQVKEKILTLIDTWQEAFGGPRARYPQYYAAYQELLRAGAVFPRKSESSAPVFTPPQSQPLSSYPPNLRNLNDRQETGEASSEAEYPSLSLTEIQNAKGIMDVLSEMLNAIEPANKESLRQEVIIDLVEQCRTYKQRVVHLVNSTSDESLLCQGLALNDDLQKVLAKHEALVSGAPVPQDKSKPDSGKSPVNIDGPLVDTGESSKQADVRASTGGTIPAPSVNGSAPTPTPTKPEPPKMDLLSGDLLGDDFTSPAPQDSLALVPVSVPQPSSPVASHQNALALVDMFSTSGSSNSQPPTSGGQPYPPPDFQHQQNLQQLPQQSTPYANGMATSMGLGLPQQQYEQPGYPQQSPQAAPPPPGWNNPQIAQPPPQSPSGAYSAYNPQHHHPQPPPASFGGAYNPQISQQPPQQPQSPVYGAQNGGSFPPPPWESQAAETNQPFSPNQALGSNHHHPFSPNQQPLSPNQQPLNPNQQPFSPAQYSPSMQVPVSGPSMYSQQMMGGQHMPNQMPGMYPQAYQSGPMMGMGPGIGMGPGPYQMQAAQMAAMYQGQMGMGGQMGGYGYGFGQQPDGGSQYLDQRMYGLSLRDDSSLRMSSGQNSVPSYLPPMKQQPKGDDKLFGDLVDMAKLKPTKSNTPGRTGSV